MKGHWTIGALSEVSTSHVADSALVKRGVCYEMLLIELCHAVCLLHSGQADTLKYEAANY